LIRGEWAYASAVAKIPSPLAGVRKWLDREEWFQPFGELLQEHLAAPCEAVGIGIDDLPEVIGADATSNLFGCVFEDMLATEFADGGNVVDDYLKRRGWKEPVPNKRYMTALRSSAMSLYEVSGIVPGESFLARDLLRSGELIQVSEKRATRRMRPWDLLAARIVKVGSRNEITGGALPLARTAGATLEEGFGALREKRRSEIQDARPPGSAELEPYALDTEVLRRVASLFSQVWLIGILRRMRDSRPPAGVNSHGEALEATTVVYPLKPDADRKALADALAAVPQLHPAPDARWDWIGPRGPLATSNEFDRADLSGNPLPEGSVSWGYVALEGDSLTLDANSPQRAGGIIARCSTGPCPPWGTRLRMKLPNRRTAASNWPAGSRGSRMRRRRASPAPRSRTMT